MTQRNIGGLHEQEANSVIADWLNAAGRDWQADAERTGALIGSNDRPDVIIRQGDRMPVIVECEYGSPAVGDAARRLGRTLSGETRPFTEVVAVGINEDCRGDNRVELRHRLDSNERIFTVQLVSGDQDESRVWPNAPMPAVPSDLVAYCEYAQVPQTVIDRESRNIAEQVESAGRKLHDSIRRTRRRQYDTLKALCEIVGCAQDDEAARTACAIWLIAIDLQNDLAAHSAALQNANLPTTQQLRDNASGVLRRDDLLDAWRVIESVNYLPVMELAINSLQAGNMGSDLSDVLRALEQLSDTVNGLHAKHIYNFAGELWQQLVGDREERAAHYTKPETAELLATLAAERFDDRIAEQIAGLNLMDAACGTGTLIGAGERAIRRKYAMSGGRDAEIHRKRMEEHIYAMDVNGIAGTLTAKRLTDMNVEQDYSSSKIAVITDPAGSLILLDPGVTGVSNVLGYRGVTPTEGAGGEEGVFHVMLQGIDWSLMNPPYSRPRGGREQATRGLAPLRTAAKRRQYLMSHGQAGLASDFGNLTNIRLAPGGVYSHVLPLTAAHAGSWKAWRTELEKDFENIVAIANVSTAELQSMSADTGMSEMLVIATKRSKRPKEWQPTEILCVNLHSAPGSLAEGYALAKEIGAIPETEVEGMLSSASYIRFQHDGPGFPWGAVGNSSNELSAVSAALLRGQAYDPLTLNTHDLVLPMVTLGDMAEPGPTHHLIGHPKGNEPIGAFEWTPLTELPVVPAQQSMWSTYPNAQNSISLSPTHVGMVVDSKLATRMTTMRSQWHLVKDLRWTAHAAAVAHTTITAHGGRSWNALQESEEDIAQCMALYYNSVVGALVRSAYAQSQFATRSQLQVGAIAGLPCPAFHADTAEAQRARDIASQNFGRLSGLILEPFAYCFRDKNRHQIDSTVAEMLGLDPNDSAVQEMLAHYRMLLAREPNVNGRQKSILNAIANYQSGD